MALHSSGNENTQEVQDKSHQSNLQASKSDESQVPSIDLKSASVQLPDQDSSDSYEQLLQRVLPNTMKTCTPDATLQNKLTKKSKGRKLCDFASYQLETQNKIQELKQLIEDPGLDSKTKNKYRNQVSAYQ